MNLKLPKIFQGRFKILELIYENEKAEIWRVEEVATKKIYALRIMYRTNLIYGEISQTSNLTLQQKQLVQASFWNQNWVL